MDRNSLLFDIVLSPVSMAFTFPEPLNFGVFTKCCTLANSLPYCLLNLPVPQAIYKGVEQRGHHCVENSNCLTEVQPATPDWFDVHKDAASVGDGDHREVGGAGRKSFLPPLGRWDVSHGGDDLDVGDKVDRQCAQHRKHSYDENQALYEPCVCTGKFNQWCAITEEMVNYILATERQLEQYNCWGNNKEYASDPRAQCQEDADLTAHDGCIA